MSLIIMSMPILPFQTSAGKGLFHRWRLFAVPHMVWLLHHYCLFHGFCAILFDSQLPVRGPQKHGEEESFMTILSLSYVGVGSAGIWLAGECRGAAWNDREHRQGGPLPCPLPGVGREAGR